MITIKSKNKKQMMDIDLVNDMYKRLAQTHKKRHISIRAMLIDGMKTIKSYDYDLDDIKYALDDYYLSYDVGQMDKFKEVLYVEFSIAL